MTQFEEISGRFRRALQVRTLEDLVYRLGLTEEDAKIAREATEIPLLWYCEAYRLSGVNPDWLQTGEGVMYFPEVLDGDRETFDAVYERFRRAAKAGTQIELAEVLEIRQSAISEAKRFRIIPSDWYATLERELGINPHWLRTGSGPMYMPHSEPAALPTPETRP